MSDSPFLASAAASPPATAEVSDATFQAEVLEGSQQMPILVDFWAPWCAPCRELTPILESLVAGEYQGRVRLVKVNVDENPMLMQALRIQSIPNVKLISEGQLVNEFMGSLPQAEICAFLDAHLPSQEQHEAASVLHELDQGDREAALQRFQEMLTSDPKNPAALLGLAAHYIDQGLLSQGKVYLEQISSAALGKLPDHKQLEGQWERLRARLFLAEQAQEAQAAAGDVEAQKKQALEGQGSMAQRFAFACQLAIDGEEAQALAILFLLVQEDRGFRDDAARRAMVAVFALLPLDSPLVQAYRQKLALVLFS